MMLRIALFASDCFLQYCPTHVQHHWTLANSPAYLNFNCRFTELCQQLSSERYLPTATLEEGEKIWYQLFTSNANTATTAATAASAATAANANANATANATAAAAASATTTTDF